MFLTSQEIATLTGVKGGSKGKTKTQRQIEVLRQMGIAFFTNVAGQPIVTKAAVEGQKAMVKKDYKGWSPAVLGVA